MRDFVQVIPDDEVVFESTLIFLLNGDYHVRLRRIINDENSVEQPNLESNQQLYEVVTYNQFSPKIILSANTD